MSIVLADAETTELPPPIIGGFLVWFVLAVLLARWLGVFRAKSIAGPQRLGLGEGGGQLLIVLFSAFVAAYVACGGLYLAFIKPDMPMREFVVTAMLFGLTFCFLLIANAFLRVDGMKRLGINLSRLPTALVLAPVTLFLLLPAVYLVSMAVTLVIKFAGWKEPKAHAVLESLGGAHNTSAIVLAVLVAVVVAPLAEELVFRGMIQTILLRAYGRIWGKHPQPRYGDMMGIAVVQSQAANETSAEPLADLPREEQAASVPTDKPAARWLAVLTTAIFFALVHREPAFMPPLFVLAVGLGYVYERTGNLWICILTHALFNSFQVLAYWFLVLRGQ